ncbi:MAG: cellulase family glycosylhydrolase [Pseudomonadota bacterium]
MTRFVGLLCACLALVGCGGTTQDPSEILHVRADRVVDRNQKPVWLRGLQFSNRAYDDRDPAGPDPASTYADQSDYQRAAAMGVNTIAFFLRSDQFEVDAAPYQYLASGFDWLDQNIAWARASGIRLILTLLGTPGTPQWQTTCDGNSVWDVPAYQDRTIALWQALSARYANEPVIAGYNPLTDPVPSGPVEQWHSLAKRLVSAIRKVDLHHLVVIEIPAGSNCAYRANSGADLFRVPDPNVLYAFAADVPWEYVAQQLPSQGLGDGGSYPDETQLLDANFLEWQHNSWDSTPTESQLALSPGDTSWTEQRFVYRVTDPNYQVAAPVLQSNYNLGKVYFDDFTVNEYDQDLNFVRTVFDVDIEEGSGPWDLYQGNDDGSECPDCGAVSALEPEAHRGKASISLSGTTSQATLSNDRFLFPAKLNYTYELKGWIKGENSSPKNASRFRFDFSKYDGAVPGFLPLRNRDGLSWYLQSFIDWGKEQQVPLYVHEFFAGRPTFSDDKGGLLWVEDMIELLKASNCHFAYKEYRSDEVGVYSEALDLSDPATVNQPLIDLLTRELTQ